jgi:hypothetical protein
VNAQQHNEFDKFWDAWFSENVDKLTFKAKDGNGRWSVAAVVPTLLRLSEAYVEKHNAGNASQSVFHIVLNLMIESGDLVPVKDESSQIPADILEFIQQAERGEISTYELRRKYLSERSFRNAYDIYTGLAQLATPQPAELTLEQYRSLPVAVVRRRMAEPAFAAAVNKLIASGQV